MHFHVPETIGKTNKNLMGNLGIRKMIKFKSMHFWKVGIQKGMGKVIAKPAENPTRFGNA